MLMENQLQTGPLTIPTKMNKGVFPIPMFEGIDMGIREVGHVDIVADAGAIAGGVVRPENIEMRALPERGLHRNLDEMRGVGG